MKSTNYELLAQCIRSGQVSDEQVAEHFKDEVFRLWYVKRYA